MKSEASPVYCKRRPAAFSLQEDLDKKIDRLVEHGMPNSADSSEWAAPIVVVCKTNRKISLCADYSTGLNTIFVADDHPLLYIEELLAKLSGSKNFSQLDLSDACHHLVLDDTARS